MLPQGRCSRPDHDTVAWAEATGFPSHGVVVGLGERPWSALRSREAISALHDVVISDLRYAKKDKSAYEAYQAERKQREAALRSGATRAARQDALARLPEPIPEGFEHRFRELRQVYWNARLR